MMNKFFSLSFVVALSAATCLGAATAAEKKEAAKPAVVEVQTPVAEVAVTEDKKEAEELATPADTVAVAQTEVTEAPAAK